MSFEQHRPLVLLILLAMVLLDTCSIPHLLLLLLILLTASVVLAIFVALEVDPLIW